MEKVMSSIIRILVMAAYKGKENLIMNIKGLLIGLSFIAGAGTTYLVLKEFGMIDDHKKPVIDRQSKNEQKYKEEAPSKDDLERASLDNLLLDPQERAEVRYIMDCYTKQALFANNDYQINDAISALWDIYWATIDSPEYDKNRRKAMIMFHQKRLDNASDLNKMVNKAVNKIDLKKLFFKK